MIVTRLRIGTSMLTNLIISRYITNGHNREMKKRSYEFNADGYFEDARLNLLNDQLIRLKYGHKYSFYIYHQLMCKDKYKQKINLRNISHLVK